MTSRLRLIMGLALAAIAGACAPTEVPPHLRPLPKETMMQLGKKGMEPAQPIFIRVFKEESELEVWKQRPDGRYYPFKTYPICNWSGELGPKVQQGDRQAPEGFYEVSRTQMNPNSSFHLAFNLGYPNKFDRVHNRSGDFLMIHGKCKSAGCYAMTDALIEEIYALARESFIGGQETFHVHAFPFRMTEENMVRHAASPHKAFWATLKEGHDFFEMTRQIPAVAVCDRRYLVNAKWRGPPPRDGAMACPAYEKPKPERFVPTNDQVAELPLLATGPKMRTAANIGAPGTAPEEGPNQPAAALPGVRVGLGGPNRDAARPNGLGVSAQ
jgi:murein L,D-transpeptidase YafK